MELITLAPPLNVACWEIGHVHLPLVLCISVPHDIKSARVDLAKWNVNVISTLRGAGPSCSSGTLEETLIGSG